MGYLGRHNNYGDDSAEEGIEMHDPFKLSQIGEDAKEAPSPDLEWLQRKAGGYRRLIENNRRLVVQRESQIADYEIKLAKIQVEIEEAKRSTLQAKLGKLGPLSVIQFHTTDTGHTYVALKVGGGWYVTQNGLGRLGTRKGVLHLKELAKLIGTARVIVASDWTSL